MANLTTTDAVIIELYDNPLTERPDDCYGRVINVASINEDTLIERAIADGFNGNADSMKAAYNAMKQVALKSIVRGEIVNFGLGHVVLDVEGAFTGSAPVWNPEVNKLVATIVSSKELRETLKTTPTKVIGLAPDQRAIISVTDVVTGRVNELLSPSGMANIKGTLIKIEGDKPEVGLFLVNQDTQAAVRIPATAIGQNDPKAIKFVVPYDVPSGNYLLSVVSQFSGGGGRFLQEPRTVTLNHILVVING